MRFGRRLWVCPDGQAAGDAQAVRVALDPGLAFGTGTHPTTALCLEWLDGSELAGCRVIDYGCGSGILAIAALKLGAAEALAFDIDPQARLATRDNAVRNGVADRLTVAATAPHRLRPAMHSSQTSWRARLTELAGRFATLLRPGGRIALSGVLVEQAETVAAAYRPLVYIGATTVRDGWALLSGSRGPITLTAMYSQCPSCKARFRVTAATLRAAHGRGRCGHCGHSFDVLAHLSDELPTAPGSAPPVATSREPGGEPPILTAPHGGSEADVAGVAGPGSDNVQDTGLGDYHFSAEDIEKVFIDARDWQKQFGDSPTGSPPPQTNRPPSSIPNSLSTNPRASRTSRSRESRSQIESHTGESLRLEAEFDYNDEENIDDDRRPRLDQPRSPRSRTCPTRPIPPTRTNRHSRTTRRLSIGAGMIRDGAAIAR